MTDSGTEPRAAPPQPAAADEAARLREVAERQPPFALTLGLRLVSHGLDRVVAEMDVVPGLTNRNGMLHGGAVMAFADNLGGTSASLHLPPGAATTTVESKTNFFRAVQVGTTVRGECVPLHVGRTTSVWQTSVYDDGGRLAAMVTQTQLTLRG